VIEPDVEVALGRLGDVVALTGGLDDDLVLFGSIVLYLHGIDNGRPTGDVDAFVDWTVWWTLADHEVGQVVRPRAGDPPILELDGGFVPIHLFYDWTGRDREWLNAGRCFELAETVRGWPCIPLDEVVRHKELSSSQEDDETQEKHRHDLRAIAEHRRRNP
jgi:hypothetical protein